ncbi:MAG: alanine:cation symporter family protein, partial [Planctomycetales bacterium]|nr:alanine:cation symporter family protein [Planctomycetales bacterium]
MVRTKLPAWVILAILFLFPAPLLAQEANDVDSGEAADEVAAEGLDQRIDRAFRPVADWWGGLVLTPVPVGTKTPPVNQLFDSATIERVGLSDEQVATLEQLREQRESDIAAASNGHDKSSILEQRNADMLATLSDEQRTLFREPRKIPVVLIALVGGAVFFTLIFGFINVRLIPFAIAVVRGKYDRVEKSGARDVKPDVSQAADGDLVDTIRDEGHSGEVSHFQALATAVSGTVGLGNISGVAVAIAVGGPGATFWMILCGFLGMSTKFVECTLGVKYRDLEPDGTVHGGPMYYLKKGLGQLGAGPIGQVLAIVFAILCVGASFGGGNAFQANQATAQIVSLAQLKGGASGAIIGLVMAVLVGVVI